MTKSSSRETGKLHGQAGPPRSVWGVHPAGHGHHMGSEYRSDTVHLVYLVL